jgi:hypothetical protein
VNRNHLGRGYRLWPGAVGAEACSTARFSAQARPVYEKEAFLPTLAHRIYHRRTFMGLGEGTVVVLVLVRVLVLVWVLALCTLHLVACGLWLVVEAGE